MTDSTAATTTLRRHNSMVGAPRKLSLPHRTTSLDAPHSRGSTLSLELVSLNLNSPSSTSYTSLRDVLPSPYAAVNSPTASASSSAAIIGDICIRNRLVKHAAWAYLQPMSSSPSASSSSAPHFLHTLSSAAAACLSFLFRRIVPCFARIFHRILHALSGQVSTS